MVVDRNGALGAGDTNTMTGEREDTTFREDVLGAAQFTTCAIYITSKSRTLKK